MSKFKAEFTLKQHTPIIHFQSEQSGATLRATELKPKFDRFLLENVEGIPFVKNANEHKSIDYKVKITSNSETIKSLANNFLYFANNAIKVEKDKTFMLINQSIKIEFFSYKTEVIQAINNLFNDFMLISNFGARNTKGYGSFNPKSEGVEQKLKKYYPYVFKIKNANTQKWEEKVDTTHKLLKSGINFKSYHKSLLFQYMCTKNIRWEKRKIKEEFPTLATGNKPIDCDIKKEYRYVRAMLGLAGINEYVVGRDRYTVTISDKNKEIDRFTSPITYKIIDNNIYLLCDKSYEKIMDKEFTFKFKGKDFNIKTPTKQEFDLYEFLKFVEKQENIISEVK